MTTKTIWLAALAMVTTAACKDDSGLTGDDTVDVDAPMIDAPPGVTIVEVPAGDISADTTWTKNNLYVLKGYVFVVGGTLTIEAGTTIRADNGSALTISRNARINAVGTVTEPIVFTSNQPTPTSGDWGGVVLLGKAPINVTGGENSIEGFANSFGDRIKYGVASPGTFDPAHSCGTIKYARIEYAGFSLAVDKELNGLTLGGCGSATVIDYVQVHLGSDDGIEMFGGNVDLKHVIVTQPDDDAIDWDFGWTGKVQFAIVQQKLGRGDKGFESDNNPNNNDLTPRSQPTIWNLTMIGGDGPASEKKQGGMHLRRGTAGFVSNAIVAYWNQFAVDIDGRSSRDQYTANQIKIEHTYFVKATPEAAIWPTKFDHSVDYDHDANPATPPLKVENDCDGAPAIPGTVNCFDEPTVIGTFATNRLGTDPMLTDPKNLTAPNWKPLAGSPVLTGCATPPAGFDTTATFCGAIGTTDWTTGWTRFPM